MKGLAVVGVAIALFSSPAFSAPLFNEASSMARPAALASNVKIVCEENGVCYRPPGRHLVARWIYGDNAFYGPYDGPHYYGSPGRRYKWSFLSPWNW
jgi:hypothetical protein